MQTGFSSCPGRFSFVLEKVKKMHEERLTPCEIVFPTAVTRLSRSDRYGSSLGLFNTMQHGGQFMGGIVAGSILGITLTRLSQFMGLIILAALMIVALFAFLQVYRVEDFRERHDR